MTENTHSSTLASASLQKANNLNGLRLLLALLVLFSHCFPLALGSHMPQAFDRLGLIAVDLFFFLSGLLVTASWLRSKSMDDFLRRRVLRIYPGFIVALLVSTVVMIAANPNGLFYKTVSWHGIKALIGNCVFLSSSSLYGPDVFAKNPHPNCVNGSLWTIPVEFGCYLTVAAIGLFKLFKFRWMALVAFVYLWLLYSKAVVLGLDIVTMDRRFFTYFLAGTCACLYFDKIPLHWSLASIALVLTVAAMFTPFWPVICPLALTYLTFYAGYVRPIGILHWCDKTDLSYGVYLYAFPVQQVIAMNIYGRNPWIMLLLAVPATMAVAWVSWHFVERRFLAMKSAPFFDRDHGGARPAEMATQDAQLRQAF